MDCSVKEEVANEIKVEPLDQDEESPIHAMNPYINAVHAMNPFNNALHAINPFNNAINPFNNTVHGMNPLDFIKDEKDRTNVGMVNEETDTAPSEIVPEVSLGTTCSICLKTFSDNSSLKRHFRKHTGEKPYSCDQCSKSFSQSGSLKMHLRTHTGEKPYSCTICTKSFSQNKDLIIHLRRHTGERPYPCIYCQRAFSDYGSRKRHLKTHTEGNVEREKPFLCSQCPKSFAMIEYLNIHFRVHTGEKPYSCDKCPKTFANKGNLNKHLETHDVKGEKSYLCYNCAKSFSLERYLKQHFLSVHKGEQFYPSLKYSKLYVQANKSDQNYIRHEDGDMGENEKDSIDKGNKKKGIEDEKIKKGIESTATALKGETQISENIQIDKNSNSSEVDPISTNNQSDEMEIIKSIKNNEIKEDEREKSPDKIVSDLINDHHELIDNSSNGSTLDPTSEYESTKKQSLIVQRPYNNKSTEDKYERRPYNKSNEDEYERGAYDGLMSNYDKINEDQIHSSRHMESPHKIFGNPLVSKSGSEKSTEDEYESTSYDDSMGNYNKISQGQVQTLSHMESPHKKFGNQFISKSNSDKTTDNEYGRNTNDGSMDNYSKINDDQVEISKYMESSHKKFTYQSFRKSGYDNPSEDDYERITYDGLMGSYNKINEDQVQMSRYMESPDKKFGYQSTSKFNSDKSPEDAYQRTAYDGPSDDYKTFRENQVQNLRHMESSPKKFEYQSTSKYDNNSHEELFDDMGNNTDARIDDNTKGKESVNNFRNDADIKPYLCSYCPESFMQHVYLLQHHLQEHKEQKWQI